MDQNELEVEVNFESWDGDGTVTVSNETGSIMLPVGTACEQLQKAADEISRRQEQLGWNR